LGLFSLWLAVATALLPSAMIWSDLAAQGANLKNSFLEELQTLAEGVEVRLDWDNPQPYPDAQSTDSAMWAWEFLRRNRPIKYSLPPELDARKNVLQNSKHW
jgi:hypothetical protein